MTPELKHSALKGHTGSRGGLFKYHAERLAAEKRVRYSVFALVFELVSEVEQTDNFLR